MRPPSSFPFFLTPSLDSGEGSFAEPRDFFHLLKPRVMSLVILTALAGMMMAPFPFSPILASFSLLAIAIGAGASGALNMWYERDIDSLMTRTKNRPLPLGKIRSETALAFGLILSCLSIVILYLNSNGLAAGLLAFTIFFYAVLYTMGLKRTTPQNIVIGGAAGALPPVIGYAAITGTIDLPPLVLFLLIFFWTPPHFWALALLRSADYARAGLPMLPNVRGENHTRLEILAYSLGVAPLGVVPWLLGWTSCVYGITAILGGGLFLFCAAYVWFAREEPRAGKACKTLFLVSILYLFVLFLLLIFERSAQLIFL